MQVPAMVAAHQSYLQTPNYRGYAGGIIHLDIETLRHFRKVNGRSSRTDYDDIDLDLVRKHADQYGDDWCTKEVNALNIATLFHVSEPMLAMASVAARKLSEEHDRWTVEDLPSRTGFMVFERPFYYLDARGVQSGLSAVSWRVYDETLPHRGHRSNVEVNMYALASDPADAYSVQLRADASPAAAEALRALGIWHLTTMIAMPFDVSIGPMVYETPMVEDLDAVMDAVNEVTGAPRSGVTMDPSILELTADPLVAYPVEVTNIGRLLYAVFWLMTQSVADLDEWTDKKLARRNRTKTRPLPMVTIIRLRHADRYGAREEGTGRWLTYRSVTRAHARRVHTKEGVKRVWISAYWRGPEDGPIHQPKRVTTLVR
jgi:hypothetical protein